MTCSGNQSGGIVGGQDFPLSSTFSLTVKDLTTNIFPGTPTAIQWRLNQPSFNVNELFSSPTHFLFGTAPQGAFAAGIDLESRGGGPGGSGRGLGLAVNGSATASGSSGAAVYGFVSGNNGSGSSGGSLNITLGPTPPADPIAHNGTLSGLGVSGLAGFGQGGSGSNGESSFDSTGGNGGQGGTGGSVFLTGTGGNWTITSTGANAPGVLLQSTAGDGGTGGNSTFTTGGTGGKGGQGGIVKFDFLAGQAAIGTGANAPGSAGLLLISQAGTGGRGGSGKIAGDGGSGGAGGGGGEIDMLATHLDITTLANSPTSPGIAAYSLGGTGGRGGDGGFFSGGGGGGGDTGVSGPVTVNLQAGTIETQALNSSGIVAQSIAGHAGAGGGQIPASFASFGANGGSAGGAGTVNVTNGASIRTNSDESIAIFAQSTGGGGGNGGSGFGIFYASGGNGGVGGNGGEVMVTNSGTLTTSGADAQGIVAQSVGGAGGNGGIPGGIVASVGGRAAAGSMGGPVTVMNSGAISTGADHIPNVPIETDTDPAKQSCSVGCSGGILAQSIGGGGGFGGTANAGWFSLGGTAGGGGNASKVEVTNTGDITTQLVDSPGITAQSVGGGGGNGGGSVSTAPFAAIAIGASGGGGGNGGVVNVYPTSGMQIHTQGANSAGVIAQSTGAGGGNGGFAAAVSAGTSFSFSVAVGGAGAASGNGQNVTVMTNVDPNYRGPADVITTDGNMSDGILAQSVGEGGGNGGFAVSVTGAAKGVSAAFALGGNGGAGGNGGNVNVISNANITTMGDMSSGLFAESTGKGGGNGGLAISGALQLTGAGLSVALGGSGEGAGTGGITTVVNAGTIQTFGAQSDGVVALSTGKGGGNAGVTVAAAASVGGQQSGNIALAVGGQGGRGGDASQVTIDNFAPVTVTGPQSRGLVAESTGGGGGNGNVTVAATLQGANPKELALAIGGNGEVAGNGGGVRVSNYAPVQTGSASVDPAMANGSPGILASSAGGSGGSGGLTGALTLGLAGSSTPLQASVAVGGAGLGGGDAALVTVDNYAPVTTFADKSPAIEASSVGGGGGDASYVLAASGILGAPKNQNTALDVTIAVGKGGGTGGIGGPVIVTNTGGALTTSGMNSDAIQAHSEGGGGGNAGALLAFTATNVKGDISANVAIGGKGGKGANGGTVTVTNDDGGTLTTSGQNSDGIRADSVGGSGGDGSLTLSGLAVNQGYSLDVAVGGNGGTGNNGGNVTAISRGPIVTMGDHSDGISAVSTGGGGGSARMTTAAGLARVAVDVSVGGTGGTGNDGGVVDVQNYDAITTTGAGSRGIFAQSEGGGGGASQAISVGIGYESTAEKPLKVALGVSVGLPGGSGGAGGPVTVTNDGTITTGGVVSVDGLSSNLQIATNESGIVASSIGGGGGTGGNALSLAPGITGGDSTYTLSVGVGGSGGKGGLGGLVTVNNNGTITTSDPESYGIFAQSIGDGGGKGGVATSIPGVLKNQTNTVNIAISIGGHGGEGNSAGPVAVTNTASVTTNGNASHAIFAQSTGSGGGDGGSAFNYFIGTAAKTSKAVVNIGLALGGHGGIGGVGNTVTVTNSGILMTTGDDANAIEAQSIGGGGGEGGNASALSSFPFTTIEANIGGTGGQGDDGGTVTITNNAGATISTTGSNSTGIYAQSIGGGGGRGGTGVLAPTINIALGGFGGENGDGGAVTVNMLGGTIRTQGSGTSYGIWAQSVGGGGGQTGGIGVGIIDTPYYTPPPGYVGTSIPMGSGGSTGNGGPVNVIMNGAITTTGASDGVGIFAQSVGGGGGVAGQAVCAAPCSDRVGSVGANGSSGVVKVSVNGKITTNGQYSHGIFAQSAAGSNSKAGDVIIGITPGAAILANGADANAIWAQSVGGTNGQINVGVGPGAVVQGGTGSSSAVRYLDGTGNILNNAGKIYTLNFENGLAVRSDGGGVAITNTGSIIGGTDLNGPANVFLNAPGGYFAPGPVVVLGAGNPLINAGVVEAGGGTIEAPTNFIGNFVQTPTGTLVVDLDPSRNAAAASNPLNVSGTATLAGQVQVRVLDLGPGRAGPQRAPILTANQGITLAGLALVPSVVGQFQLLDPPEELALGYDIDFAAPQALAGLNGVDAAIAAWLQRAYLATGLPPALSYLLGAGNAAQYGALLAGLSPEAYAVNRWATALSALQFSDRLLACDGDSTVVQVMRGKDCISFAVEGWQYRRHGSQAGADYTLNADQFSLVMQHQFDPQLRLNFGIGYGNWTAEATGSQWKTTTGQFDTGIMLEKQIGGAMFGAGLIGGFSNPEVSRTIFPGLTASGNQNLWYIGPTLHADYRFQFGNWYLKPKVSFNATYVSAGPVSESARRFGFSIQQQSQLFASLSPALEVGGQFGIAPGYVLHPRFSVGLLQFLSNPSPSVSADFAGPLAIPSPLTVTSGVDRSYLDLHAGIDLATIHNFSLGLSGFARLSANSHQVGGGFRIAARF